MTNTYPDNAPMDVKMLEEIRCLRCVLERTLRVMDEGLFLDYQMEKFGKARFPPEERGSIRCHNPQPCQYKHSHPLGDKYGGTCKDEQFGNYCQYATNTPMERGDDLQQKMKSMEGEVRKYLNFLKSDGMILVVDENMIEGIMEVIKKEHDPLGLSREEVYGIVQRWLKYGG